ncbi:15498_t:CDS:2 [Dentiscutata erythropus]|uniref:15498_t:CDS:1 n=1 Tax=Dentiscutata erythropus TaxID=1348616 RepID=A0A9N9HL62_9GLOM|nr:15498_t:CDS:2 [Dentiscutata erythropus]
MSTRNLEIKIFELNEGFYPHFSILCYILPPKNCPIPDNYSIKTTWRRRKNQRTVQCEIEYKNGHSEFRILFGKHIFKSDESASKVATEYNKLQTLNEARKSRSKRTVKPANQYSQKSLENCAKKKIATTIKENFIQSTKSNYHLQDFIELKSFKYTINNQNYFINFEKDDPVLKKAKLLNIVNIIDSSYIS